MGLQLDRVELGDVTSFHCFLDIWNNIDITIAHRLERGDQQKIFAVVELSKIDERRVLELEMVLRCEGKVFLGCSNGRERAENKRFHLVVVKIYY